MATKHPKKSGSVASEGTGGFRAAYTAYGVSGYYGQFGSHYFNPHEDQIKHALWLMLDRHRADLRFDQRILDLACGSGEASVYLDLWLQKNKPGLARQDKRGPSALHLIDATDPYTYQAYEDRLGRPAEKLSFEDIEQGAMVNRNYGLIIASFALHLVEPSRLIAFSTQIALISQHLIVLTPHKRPILDASMGWELVDELKEERVRCRLYRSLLLDAAENESDTTTTVAVTPP